MSEIRTLAREEGIRAGVGGRKDKLTSKRRLVPRRRRRASKKGLPKRSRRKHERVSGCKSSPGGSSKSCLYSEYGQT